MRSPSRSAASRLAWLRRSAAAGLLTLPMLHGAPTGSAQAPVPRGGEFQVNTTAVGNQRNPAVAVAPDGDFVIVWDSRGQDGSGAGIYAQRYTADGAPDGPEFLVNTSTPNDQIVPSVAVDADGDFIVTWTSYLQDGDGYGVYGQRFAADGTRQGSEFQINTSTVNVQFGPHVALDGDGDFVVAWDSYSETGSFFDVYVQRFRADGAALGPEVQVNAFTTGTQSLAALGVDADGDFVVAWASFNQDLSDFGVVAKRFAADGTPVGPEFQVNAFTTGDQAFPAIALAAGGDFVIAWHSEGQDGDDLGIAAQRFAADGTQRGGEFLVNTVTTGAQRSPSIAVDAEGRFVVVWRGPSRDGESVDIFARRYAADGVPDGEPFRVNTVTAGLQYTSSIGMNETGDFLVVWASRDQDGDGDGIFAQRYAASPVAAEDTAPSQPAAIDAVFPNPVREAATVRYALSTPAAVRLTVTDVLGRTVLTRVQGVQAAGQHEAELALGELESGVYVVSLDADAVRVIRRVTVLTR
ncbi:MAG: T9SS type A sorting domain-containing protein [Bacteroidota bacterium]